MCRRARAVPQRNVTYRVRCERTFIQRYDISVDPEWRQSHFQKRATVKFCWDRNNSDEVSIRCNELAMNSVSHCPRPTTRTF